MSFLSESSGQEYSPPSGSSTFLASSLLSQPFCFPPAPCVFPRRGSSTMSLSSVFRSETLNSEQRPRSPAVEPAFPRPTLSARPSPGVATFLGCQKLPVPMFPRFWKAFSGVPGEARGTCARSAHFVPPSLCSPGRVHFTHTIQNCVGRTKYKPLEERETLTPSLSGWNVFSVRF